MGRREAKVLRASNGPFIVLLALSILVALGGCRSKLMQPMVRCTWLASRGVVEQCATNGEIEKSFTSDPKSTSFVLVRDHKTWGAITIWDSEHAFNGKAAQLESGFVAGDYENHVYRCCKAVLSVKGKLTTQELDEVQNMFVRDLPRE